MKVYATFSDLVAQEVRPALLTDETLTPAQVDQLAPEVGQRLRWEPSSHLSRWTRTPSRSPAAWSGHGPVTPRRGDGTRSSSSSTDREGPRTKVASGVLLCASVGAHGVRCGSEVGPDAYGAQTGPQGVRWVSTGVCGKNGRDVRVLCRREGRRGWPGGPPPPGRASGGLPNLPSSVCESAYAEEGRAMGAPGGGPPGGAAAPGPCSRTRPRCWAAGSPVGSPAAQVCIR